jgi:GNAT superfamily N-acetyltransferase
MPALVENYWALYEEVRENPDLGIGLFPARPSLGAEGEWFARLFRGVQEGTSVAGVAEEDGKAVALCNVNRKDPLLEGRHIGTLGLLVARPYRRRGIGKALLRYTIERCRGKFEQLELSVFFSNTAARDLYRSVGFQPWGVEPKAILREGRYTDVEHMVLPLR